MNPAVFGIPFAAMVMSIQRSDTMTELMRRYDLLRAELIELDEFPELWTKGTITGMAEISPDGVGYNIGKGYEIFVCTKGPLNSVMHVFLHELAHNTVNEYDHTDRFWDNLARIKIIAVNIGIYQPIGSHVPFCDSTIGD